MKKFFLLFMLIAWPFLANAQEWALADSAGTILSGASDKDTVLFVFPQGTLPKKMGSDTTKNARTAMLPPDFIRAAGDFDIWLDLLTMAGTADSFKVFYKVLHPWTGRLARNDSTFILGSASTFAPFTSTSRYSITLPISKGFGLVIQKGTVATKRSRIVATAVYSQ